MIVGIVLGSVVLAALIARVVVVVVVHGKAGRDSRDVAPLNSRLRTSQNWTGKHPRREKFPSDDIEANDARP